MRSDPKGGGNIAMDGGKSSRTLVIEGGLAPYALLTPALTGSPLATHDNRVTPSNDGVHLLLIEKSQH